MGLGQFGGGIGAVQFLLRHGARVTLTDQRPADQLADSLAQIDISRLERLTLGSHDPADFMSADVIVVNPAIPRDHPLLELARREGISLTSEMNLFWQHNRGKVLAVTGSNGKSTTTAMCHAIMQAAGRRCRLGGNIGCSLLRVVDEILLDDWVVLELSSFQLHDLNRISQSPDVAIITNFSPNHLDWHGTIENYRYDKQSILRWQMPHQTAVLNRDDADVCTWPTNGRRLDFGLTAPTNELGMIVDEGEVRYRDEHRAFHFPLRDWVTLPGVHNFQNALAAACGTLAVGIPLDAVERGLRGYQPLPHRLQFVAEIQGRRFYNDSLATTPESAIFALEAFDRPIVLLAGGYDKQVDLTAFAHAISRRTKAVALMGQTAGAIDNALSTSPAARRICTNFRDAWDWAFAQSAPGDIVLLSPGCASYDWFRNFADRGEQFTAFVKEFRSKHDSLVATNESEEN